MRANKIIPANAGLPPRSATRFSPCGPAWLNSIVGFDDMKMPSDILTFLLRGGHLNVEERKAKGLWPNESLRYSEVIDHLAGLIQTEEWFPRMMPEHRPGDMVYERTVVQRVSPSLFVCHSRRPSVYDLRIVAEEAQTEFSTARAAAEFYLKWELKLPGRLDSWPVE